MLWNMLCWCLYTKLLTLCVCSTLEIHSGPQLQQQGPWIFRSNGRKAASMLVSRNEALAFNLKFLQSIKFVFSEVQAGDGERAMDEHNYSVPLIESRCEASAGLNDDRFNGNTTLRSIFRHNFSDFVRISSSGRDSLWSGRHFWHQRAFPGVQPQAVADSAASALRSESHRPSTNPPPSMHRKSASEPDTQPRVYFRLGIS